MPLVEPHREPAVTPALLESLHALLPAGGVLHVGWDDPMLGQGGHSHPPATPPVETVWPAALDPSARMQRWEHDGAVLSVWIEQAQAPAPAAWWALARQTLELALQRGRQAGQIIALEGAERLQQALFQIADLAGADLEMPEMLRHVHAVLNTLMYAQNCFIVEYDDVRHTLRFLYFADQIDDFVADPEHAYAESELAGSLTFALLRHGQPLSGPSRTLLEQLGEPAHQRRGPQRQDWLGVPMLREGRVCGAIVMQSYDQGDQ